MHGSVFYFHRPGFADTFASALFMRSLVFILYTLVAPKKLHFDLHGKKFFPFIAHDLGIYLFAIVLLSIATIRLSTTILLFSFDGTWFKYAFIINIATLHFLAMSVLH